MTRALIVRQARSARWAPVLVAIPLSWWACTSHPLTQPVPEPETQSVLYTFVAPVRQLDLVFMTDNSPSIAPKQKANPAEQILVAGIFGWPIGGDFSKAEPVKFDLRPNPTVQDTVHPYIYDYRSLCYDPNHRAKDLDPKTGFDADAWGWGAGPGIRESAFIGPNSLPKCDPGCSTADRHPPESNYQLTLSGCATKRSECGPRCGDGVVSGGEECDCGDGSGTLPDGCASKNDDSAYGGAPRSASLVPSAATASSMVPRSVTTARTMEPRTGRAAVPWGARSPTSAVGMSLAFGKEWWVARDWALGLAAQAHLANMSGVQERTTATSYAMLLSATYN